MGKRRTPAEMIADQEASLIKLRRRHAIETAKDSPELSALVGRFEEIEEQVKKAAILSSDGPQGFEYRLAGKRLWIVEIEAQMALSEALTTDGEALVNDLRDTIGDLASSLADGQDCTESIESAMNGASEFDSPELETLFRNFEVARSERQAHSDARTAN